MTFVAARKNSSVHFECKIIYALSYMTAKPSDFIYRLVEHSIG